MPYSLLAFQTESLVPAEKKDNYWEVQKRDRHIIDDLLAVLKKKLQAKINDHNSYTFYFSGTSPPPPPTPMCVCVCITVCNPFSTIES